MLQKPHLSFHLTGLSCQKCVNKVNEALTHFSDIEQFNVTKTELSLRLQQSVLDAHGALLQKEALAHEIQATISALGFQATAMPFSDLNLAEVETIELELTGLSCQKCVSKVKTALIDLPFIHLIHIDKTHALMTFNRPTPQSLFTIPENAVEKVISSITDLGYGALLVETQHVSPLHDENDIPHLIDIENGDINTLKSQQIQPILFSKPPLDMQTQLLSIEGMSCASCVKTIETALHELNVLSYYQVNLANESVLIAGQPSDFKLAIEALNRIGYPATQIGKHNNESFKKTTQAKHESLWIKTVVSLIAGAAFMLYGAVEGMSLTADNRQNWILIGILTLGLMWFTGGHFYKNAWLKLKHKQTNMDTLVVLGISAAFAYSFFLTLFPTMMPADQRHLYFESSIMIIGLINLGKLLEIRAKKRASAALEQLLDLTPLQAVAIFPSGDKIIELSTVTPGMLLRLRTGDKVPVDGIIQSGVITLDESLLTGESKEVTAKPTKHIYAGCHVLTGSATFVATEVGESTALAQIIKTVQKAQSSKPKLAKLADKVASIFVPIILLIALFTAMCWLVFGPEPKLSYALLTTISVLIIACPCALGLAIPISIITSVARAAKLGVLVTDASVLERATKIDTLIFDKTGTLTEGTPHVVDIINVKQIITSVTHQQDTRISEGQSQLNESLLQELMWLSDAASLEIGSSHPLALAIKTAFEARLAQLPEFMHAQSLIPVMCEGFENAPGLGIKGKVRENTCFIGNLAWMEENQIELADLASVHQQIIHYQEQGATLLYFAKNKDMIAIFVVQDKLQTEAKTLISTLSHSFEIWLLTGDNRHSADYVASQLGITKVLSEIKPLEKVNQVRHLQALGKKVAMIGDGINDAPALASADLSIAMGQGSDIAKQSADFILLNNDLAKLPKLFDLARAVDKNMKQNLFFAFAYNILLIPVAAGVLYPISGLLLNPMLSAFAMALSSVTVVLNANRLLKN